MVFLFVLVVLPKWNTLQHQSQHSTTNCGCDCGCRLSWCWCWCCFVLKPHTGFARLGPRQVFVHVSGVGPVVGLVVLARNPCHDPSDLVVCEAVDPTTTPPLSPTLPPLPASEPVSDRLQPWKHLKGMLVDVVVLSVELGEHPKSTAERLSGGDFDGDTCWVCWDPAIVASVQPLPPEAVVDNSTNSTAAYVASRANQLERKVHRQSFLKENIGSAPVNASTDTEGSCPEQIATPSLCSVRRASTNIPTTVLSETTSLQLFHRVAESAIFGSSALGRLASLHEEWADYLAADGGASHPYCRELAALCRKAVSFRNSECSLDALRFVFVVVVVVLFFALSFLQLVVACLGLPASG